MSVNNADVQSAALQVFGATEQALQTTNEEIGVSSVDIIPRSALDTLIAPERDRLGMPIHEQILIHQFAPVFRETLADAYFGQEPVSLKTFAGKVVQVYGMILYEVQGPWKDKQKVWHPEGYFQIRMLIEDEDAKGNPLVVAKSSGAGLARHVFHILKNRGWYLFETPIAYRVDIGSDNVHRIFRCVEGEELKERLAKGAREA